MTFGKIVKKIHPEGIPRLGTKIYSLVSRSNIFQKHYEAIASDIATYCSDGSLLDVGTGPGWLLAKIHDRSPGLELTGLDISPSMVLEAAANMKQLGISNGIEITHGDVVDLPFPDKTFDLVVSTGSLHHWKNPIAGLNSVHRVLKDGGHALLYDLVGDTPKEVLFRASREFGRLKILLLWLHAFEEPFYRSEDLRLLHRSSPFHTCTTKFVGVMNCLILKKT